MRELKFRVWDIDQKRYLTERESEWYIWIRCNGDIYVSEGGGWELTFERFIVEQFTGLKDSKGKDIYEGDVIQYENFRNVISFKDGLFGYNSTGNWVRLYNSFFDWVDGEGLNIEIIGNINENPELI